MNVWAWIVIAYCTLSALTSIWMVGKPRDPVTPGIAVAATITVAILIVFVVLAATH